MQWCKPDSGARRPGGPVNQDVAYWIVGGSKVAGEWLRSAIAITRVFDELKLTYLNRSCGVKAVRMTSRVVEPPLHRGRKLGAKVEHPEVFGILFYETDVKVPTLNSRKKFVPSTVGATVETSVSNKSEKWAEAFVLGWGLRLRWAEASERGALLSDKIIRQRLWVEGR